MPFDQRKDAYDADVTYGTNSEFGFDYLRDNMAVSLDGVVQRGHPYAIVDEVDSILIDEARTPLIISGEPETAAQLYYDFARVVPAAGRASARRPGDPKGAAETGRRRLRVRREVQDGRRHRSRASRRSSARSGSRTSTRRRTRSSSTTSSRRSRRESLYQRDVEYVIEDDEVKIVDEFTGRIMEGPPLERGPAPGGRGEGGRHASRRST